MNYAVREVRVVRAPDSFMFQTKCSDFVKVDGGNLWLPKKCEVTSAAWELRPAYVARRPIYATLTNIESISRRQFAEDEFVIWYGYPGSLVADSTHEKASEGRPYEYVIPASEDNLNRIAWGSSGLWFIMVNLVAIAAITIALVWRRFSR